MQVTKLIMGIRSTNNHWQNTFAIQFVLQSVIKAMTSMELIQHQA